MCGIAGIINLNGGAIQASTLQTMSALLAHRGPDDSGIYLDENMGFLHTRLSIQDLSLAAHQPMRDEYSKSCLVFNGEIYNFKQLKGELETQGVHFTSTGDTEVLLKCCLHYGVEKTLTKLNGMFSFLFWDGAKKELWLARDRMGIKPLYYCKVGDLLYFASEIKALLPFIGKVEVNNIALLNTLCGGATYEPNTLFKGIHALNPGHFAVITPSSKQCIAQVYFSCLSCVDESLYRSYEKASMTEMTKEFSRLMTNSVDLHSISDAPIASLLSGGIDSSLISALAQKNTPDLALYHADVIGSRSEKTHALAVAKHLNLPFVSEAIDKVAYAENLVSTTYYHEFPSSYHANDVPFQLIAKRASEDGIKVLLTGEGADELFLGYGKISKDIFVDRLASSLERMPGLKRFKSKFDNIFAANFESTVLKSLATGGDVNALRLKAEQAYDFVQDPVEKNALVQSQVYLKAHLNSLLQRNDRMGMMHGLESRIPFLENELVNFALNLPVKFKRPHSLFQLLKSDRQRNNKLVVRNAAYGRVPKHIITRKKVGFPVSPSTYIDLPAEFFKNGFLQQQLDLTLNEIESILSGLPAKLRWNFFSTELFGRIFFLGESQQQLNAKIYSYLK